MDLACVHVAGDAATSRCTVGAEQKLGWAAFFFTTSQWLVALKYAFK